MKIAIRKDTLGSVPMGGFIYMTHPIAMKDENEASTFALMGYIIAEVEDKLGQDILNDAFKALNHQVNIAVIAENAIKEKK